MKPQLRSFIIVFVGLFWAPLALAIPAPASTPTVYVNSVSPAPLFDRLTYPAKIQPRVEAVVLAEFDGVIEKIQVNLGSKVVKGQPLLSLRRTDPVYQFASLQVKSPVSGVVSQIDFTHASQVQAGQRIMTVIDPRQPKVVIELAAADLEDVKIGMIGELKPVGIEKQFDVKVAGISPFIDSATGTATCELEVIDGDQNAKNLPPGLMGKVSFKVRERQGIQVPENAIVFRGKETFVRVVEDNTVRLTSVKLGSLARGNYEILGGVKSGSAIIIRSSQYVADGQKVEVHAEEKAKFE